MTLTICWPFHSSHTSLEVEDMSSDSATARLSRARPIMALSHDGPPTRIAATMAVMIPKGAMAKIMLSAIPTDWLMNCIVTLSPKSANKLCEVSYCITTPQHLTHHGDHVRSQVADQIVGDTVSCVACCCASDETGRNYEAGVCSEHGAMGTGDEYWVGLVVKRRERTGARSGSRSQGTYLVNGYGR